MRTATLTPFAEDVLDGLSAFTKRISSRWFYDETGDKLFQKIMELPEYYLTRAEYEILERYAGEIVNQFPVDELIQLVELGAGDGLKTRLILKALLKANRKFRYVPIDISLNALQNLRESLTSEFLGIEILALQTDYFSALKSEALTNSGNKLVLFLGSNVGNLSESDAPLFFGQLSASLKAGDSVITGFDRVKEEDVILAAYNDRSGVTKAFNLNLLTRINRELDGNFQLEDWAHKPAYDPIRKAATSSLVSLVDQEVRIEMLDSTFSFNAGEQINTEISRKFAAEDISELAVNAGFNIRKNFEVKENWFTDSWWSKE